MMNSEIKRIANSYAEEFCSDAIYPSHLFKAVLHKDMGLVHFLETELDKDYFYLQDWADIQMQLSPRATRPSSDLELSDEGQAVMDEAFSYQEKFGMSSCLFGRSGCRVYVRPVKDPSSQCDRNL